jgi:hypothetical protein
MEAGSAALAGSSSVLPCFASCRKAYARAEHTAQHRQQQYRHQHARACPGLLVLQQRCHTRARAVRGRGCGPTSTYCSATRS